MVYSDAKNEEITNLQENLRKEKNDNKSLKNEVRSHKEYIIQSNNQTAEK